MEKMPRFAVVLSGCGRADGSEIHESVTALLAIDTMGCTYDCFAPDIEQAMVVNNITSEIVEERRNVLVESGRIARGNIKPLSEINLNEYDCILFPGGLGAITNWCDFQTKGIACDVDTSISNVLENGTYILYSDRAKEILESAFGIKDIKQGHFLKGIISRKKQI